MLFKTRLVMVYYEYGLWLTRVHFDVQSKLELDEKSKIQLVHQPTIESDIRSVTIQMLLAGPNWVAIT